MRLWNLLVESCLRLALLRLTIPINAQSLVTASFASCRLPSTPSVNVLATFAVVSRNDITNCPHLGCLPAVTPTLRRSIMTTCSLSIASRLEGQSWRDTRSQLRPSKQSSLLTRVNLANSRLFEQNESARGFSFGNSYVSHLFLITRPARIQQ